MTHANFADDQNFAVAEEQKRKRQIEEFIRKAEPISAHVSWIDRLNPYRLMSANRNAVKVNTLPANLVLPLKQSVGPDVGALPGKVGVLSTFAHFQDADGASSTKGAMQRLFGRRQDAETIPLRNLKRSRPRSARIEDLDYDVNDDRGLYVQFTSCAVANQQERSSAAYQRWTFR